MRGDATYVFDALNGVVIGHLDGGGFGFLLALILNDLAQFVPPKVTQHRRTVDAKKFISLSTTSF